MNDILHDLVAPALDDLELRYDDLGDCLCLNFRGRPAAYHVCIRHVETPSLLWIRLAPAMWANAETSEIMTLLAGLNYHEWMLRASCDPRDGEIIFDSTIMVYDGLSKELVADMVAHTCSRVGELLETVLRVQWGGLSAQAALERLRAGGEEPLSGVERQVKEIVDGLETDGV